MLASQELLSATLLAILRSLWFMQCRLLVGTAVSRHRTGEGSCDTRFGCIKTHNAVHDHGFRVAGLLPP